MQMRILGSAIAAAALLLMAAAPADAQRTADHSGFWISFGFGGGTAFGDDAWDGDTKFGGAGFLRMGGSPSQQLLIGGELIGWGADQGSAEWEIRVDDVTATVRDDQGGIGLGAGLGMDVQLARNFFLTPALDFVYTGTEGDGASLLLFTIGATWH